MVRPSPLVGCGLSGVDVRPIEKNIHQKKNEKSKSKDKTRQRFLDPLSRKAFTLHPGEQDKKNQPAGGRVRPTT